MDVFISYARRDGEATAAALYERLEQQGIRVWMDRMELRGGRSWWRQITDVIDEASFLVLIATQAALESEFVHQELRYARQHGVCIFGVMVDGHPIGELPMPNWMRKTHFYNLALEWDKFVAHLQEPCQVNRVPLMTPALDEGYVPRSAETQQILTSLVNGENPVAAAVALWGPDGYGKSTLAAAICHDAQIETAFDDGILWVTLGNQPDLLGGVTRLYRSLSGDTKTFIDIEEAAQALSERLTDLDCLMVIDDVWERAHLLPFMRSEDGVARLITTRLLDVAMVADRQIMVEQMPEAEALQILRGRLPEVADLAPFRDLARRLGGMPMMLQLVAEAVRQRIARGDQLNGALKWINLALDRQGLDAFDSDRYLALSRTVEVSLELLPVKDQARYVELAIFPQDEDIPLGAACSLWGLDEFASERLIETLYDLSLLKFNLRAGVFRLHDVIRTYLSEKLDSDKAVVHEKLLGAWDDFYDLPDDYAWRWLGYHLHEADRHTDLRDLLLDFNWLEAKLMATDPNALLQDYERLNDDLLWLVESALRNAAHVIAEDPSQLAGQLGGRLMAFDAQQIINLVQQTTDYATTAWIEPRTPALPRAGGPLQRTLQGHHKIVTAAKILPDGQRVASVASDGLLKLWRLSSGLELLSIDVQARLTDVAATDDLLVAGSSNGKLYIFDAGTGDSVHTIEAHARPVESVAIAGNLLASGGSDGDIKLWDLTTGECLTTLNGHVGIINVVEMSNGYLISGGSDKTARVWSLDDYQERLCLHHDSLVYALDVNDECVYAACKDGTVSIWSLDSGQRIDCFKLHRESIAGIKVIDNLLLTASADSTACVWDRETGEQILPLKGHKWPLNDIEVTTDGELAVTASADMTLKVWRLNATPEDVDIPRHADCINSVAITPRHAFAISASADDTLKVWSMDDCSLIRTLHGHNKHVNSVVLTPSGRFAISAGSDGYLKMWDVVSGVETWSAKPYTRAVTSLALTSDGKRLLCGFTDGTLKILNVATGNELASWDGHDKKQRVNAVALSLDDTLAASTASGYFGSQHSAFVWDLASGECLMALDGHKRKINALAFGPDCLVTASNDRTLKVWNLGDHSQQFTLEGHREHIHALTVYEDLIVSGSDDGLLRLWRLSDGRPVVSFHTEDALSSVAMDGDDIVAGGTAGKIHFLRLHK